MKNIYISAMEIGFANPWGITYKELLHEIEKVMDIKLSYETEFALVQWVLTSFSTVDDLRTNSPLLSSKDSLFRFFRAGKKGDFLPYTDLERMRLVIRGEVVKQYVDYLELKEARKQSRRAFKISILSIVIALVSVLLPTYLSYYEPEPSTPPFDVKIIEDKTKDSLLEEENKRLKKELYKAEILISTYEN